MKLRWMITLLLLLTVPITAFAKESHGYIRLKMAYDGRPVTGGTVTLYHVSDSPGELDPAEMFVYVKESGIVGLEIQVDESGYVLFDGLPAGQYLLAQQKAAPGYYPIKPFLIHLKTAAGGTMVDSVDASPKMEPEGKLPQTGQLVWPAWALLGSGIMFVGIGILAWKRE